MVSLRISGASAVSRTFLRAAACLRTTRAADVAAALLRTALAATYAEERDEQEGADEDQQDGQPVCNKRAETRLLAFHSLEDFFSRLFVTLCRASRAELGENSRYTMSFTS